MKKHLTIQIVIPAEFKEGLFLAKLFRTHIPGFMATVLDSGNTWVELSLTTQGASVKLGVLTNDAVRFYPGSTVIFDLNGHLLRMPDLARSKRPKLLPAKTGRAPARSFKQETTQGQQIKQDHIDSWKTRKGLGY